MAAIMKHRTPWQASGLLLTVEPARRPRARTATLLSSHDNSPFGDVSFGDTGQNAG